MKIILYYLIKKDTWAVVRLPFEMERKDIEFFNTFKIYHDSSKSENFIIRTMAFHYVIIIYILVFKKIIIKIIIYNFFF